MDLLGQEFVFTGGPRAIVKQIASLQKKNGVYESDEPIWDYCNSIWCKRDPKRCMSEEVMTQQNVRQTRSKALRFLIALKALVKNGLQPVEKSVADERAKICSRCPHNKKTEKCGMCIATAKAITKGLIGNRQTKYDANLKQCAQCGCELKAKVHFPITEDGVTYPAHCWVTKERKSGKV